MIAALSLAAVVLLAAFGQVALKRGVDRLVTGRGARALLASVSPPLLVGLAAALAAPPFYFVAVARVDLGLAFAATALTQAAVAFASRLLLGERLAPGQAAGIALIVAGLLLWGL